jgi:hypothetical protein
MLCVDMLCVDMLCVGSLYLTVRSHHLTETVRSHHFEDETSLDLTSRSHHFLLGPFSYLLGLFTYLLGASERGGCGLGGAAHVLRGDARHRGKAR